MGLSPENFRGDGLSFFLERVHARPSTKRPSIGWEFEVPLDAAYLVSHRFIYEPCEIEDDWELEESGFFDDAARWWEERGFRTHFECGGIEMASPIHRNLAQARATARDQIEALRKMPYVTPDAQESPYNCCGIHVHAGSNDPLSATTLADLVLNREESGDFLEKLSGRNRSDAYAHQAIANCWDARKSAPYHNNVVRQQSHTVEYRLFNGVANRLIPGIEFAHAFTRWLQPYTPRMHEYYRSLFGSTQYVSSQSLLDPRNYESNKGWLNENVPHLSEFKEWLMKQPGYRVLKNEPAMQLI